MTVDKVSSPRWCEAVPRASYPGRLCLFCIYAGETCEDSSNEAQPRPNGGHVPAKSRRDDTLLTVGAAEGATYGFAAAGITYGAASGITYGVASGITYGAEITRQLNKTMTS
jgi:hypothetical protein